MRYTIPVVAALFLGFVAGGCGGEANQVPDVESKRLDVAQETLDDAGLGYEVIGGGDLGVVLRRNWRVCEQRPRSVPARSRSSSTSGARASATSRTISTTTTTTTRTTMTTSDLASRLDDFGRRLAGLEQEFRELRELARAEEFPSTDAPIVTAPVPPPPPPPPPPAPPPKAAAAKPLGPGLERATRSAARLDREVSLDDLLGRRRSLGQAAS